MGDVDIPAEQEDRMADEQLLGERYRRGASLGSGAMGEVWAAQDEVLGRRVAVKQLRLNQGLDEHAADRMVREARVAARLHHPNVVTVFDLVVQDGQPFVVMEFVEGESLAERLRRVGTLGGPEAARVAGQVAAALAAAAGAGIVHRDVKPANVLLGVDGSVKLADFGIARGVQDLALTDTGQMLGTVAYMAPEVARTGSATAASDVWSLGATLYSSLQGHAPHAGGGQQHVTTILARLITEPVVQPPSAGRLGPVLMAMLDPEPARRPTAAEAARRLGALAAGGRDAVESTRVRPTPPAHRPEPRWMTTPLPVPGPPQDEPGTIYRTTAAPAPTARAVGAGRSRGLLVGAVTASVLAVLAVAGLVAYLVLDQQAGTDAVTAAGTTAAAPTSGAVAVTTPAPATAAPTTPAPTTVPQTTVRTVPPTTAPTTTELDLDQEFVTGADAQGFSQPGARCNADDPAVFTGYSAESRIVVCLTGDDRYYYKGLRTRDGAAIELDDPVPTGSGFTARNGGTTYDVSGTGFTITGPSGEQLTSQPWIEYTGPD